MREETIKLEQAIQAVDESAPGEFMVYTEGICFASVCSSLPQLVVEAKMRQRPSGTHSGWAFAADHPTFSGGQPNPCPCEQLPETHKHYLFVC